MSLSSVDEQRAALAAAPVRAPVRYRVLHLGTYRQGDTDIVRRMVEALRSLGHDVIAVDPRAWPRLGDARHVDGIRPIEIDDAPMEHLIARFRPHVMVWNAGGFHPSRAGAARLRARGIPLVHVVLSDPDVRDTTLSILDRFDAVVTNAASCVEGYRRAGIGFAAHMPFAVDSSFVLARVVTRPDWRSDVVCVGHGREDRQDAMRRLHDRFGARAFGTNWDIPAEAVRDADVLSALDAGSIHVNFPRTFAGFTNVKVGVFESIGRGGVVCTERFDEMGDLFAYDEEIAGYRNTDDLLATVEGLLADPDTLEHIRRRGFARLIGEHLYEHRWNGLFASLRESGALTADPDTTTVDVAATLAADLDGALVREQRALDENGSLERALADQKARYRTLRAHPVVRASVALRNAIRRLGKR